MSSVTEALRKIGKGFLYGLGFVLGGWIAMFLVAAGTVAIINVLSDVPISFTGPTRSVEEHPRALDVAFSNENAIKTEYQVTIVGTIENRGRTTSRYLNVYADLYDKDGAFIFQCMHQISGGVRPGEKENFKIECYNMTPELLARYHSYRLYTKAP